MTAIWPSTITIVQFLPISFSPVDQRNTYKSVASNPMVDSPSTDQIYRTTFDVMLSGSDVRTDFIAFWEGALARGASDFTGVESVITDQPVRYKFTDQQLPSFSIVPAAAGINADTRVWRGTFDLWQLR
jgi:hypothetical protein